MDAVEEVNQRGVQRVPVARSDVGIKIYVESSLESVIGGPILTTAVGFLSLQKVAFGLTEQIRDFVDWFSGC
jgi:hypothetical protein